VAPASREDEQEERRTDVGAMTHVEEVVLAESHIRSPSEHVHARQGKQLETVVETGTHVPVHLLLRSLVGSTHGTSSVEGGVEGVAELSPRSTYPRRRWRVAEDK